jgi:hypothetical protein
VAHWCRRLADTLVALVLSKFVVAAVLSLAAGATAGGLGVSSSGNGGGFAAVVSGIALILIAVLAPFTLLRLVPAVEAGAVAHLESTRHRLKSATAAPLNNGRNLALDLMKKSESPSEGDGVGAVGTIASVGAAAAGTGAVGGAVVGGGAVGGVAAGRSAAGSGAARGTGVATSPLAMVAGNPDAALALSPKGSSGRSKAGGSDAAREATTPDVAPENSGEDAGE